MVYSTCDGATVNSKTLHEFGKEIDIADAGWIAREHDILYAPNYLFGGITQM